MKKRFEHNYGGNLRSRLFRRLLLGLAVLSLPAMIAAETRAAEIVRVLPEFREEESFHRISEFFTGRENTGRSVILRSDPEVREGFYVNVRLRKTDRPTFPEGTARLEVALPDERRVRRYEYPLDPVARRRPLVLLGITGDDWPEEIERPLAWKISFFDAGGELLDSEQSFLWSAPGSEPESE